MSKSPYDSDYPPGDGPGSPAAAARAVILPPPPPRRDTITDLPPPDCRDTLVPTGEEES